MPITITGAVLKAVSVSASGGPIRIPAFFAPLNNSTTANDVIPPEIAPQVLVPTNGVSIEYTANSAVFDTANITSSAWPSITWPVPYNTSKLDPGLYPDDSIFLSADVSATGVENVTGAGNSDITYFLQMTYFGGTMTFGFYTTAQGLQLWSSASLGNGSQYNPVTLGPIGYGFHNYSIEWTPDGQVVWRVDGVVRRITAGFTRISGWVGVQTWATGYYGAGSAGVYTYEIRNVSYDYGTVTVPWAWTNPGANYASAVFSNNCQTITASSVQNATSIPLAGRVYCEFECNGEVGTSTDVYKAFGVQSLPENIFYNQGVNIFSGILPGGGCGLPGSGVAANGTIGGDLRYQFSTRDRIGIAVDADTGYVWFSINGVWVGLNSNPAGGSNPDGVLSGAGPFYFVVSDYLCGAVTGPWSWSMYPRANAQRDPVPAGFVSYQS
jgi:hypothetical protein